MKWIFKLLGQVLVILFSATLGGLYVWKSQQQASRMPALDISQDVGKDPGKSAPEGAVTPDSGVFGRDATQPPRLLLSGSKSAAVSVLPLPQRNDPTSNRALNGWLIDLEPANAEATNLSKVLSQPANNILPETEKLIPAALRNRRPPLHIRKLMAGSKNATVENIPRMGQDAVDYLLSAPVLDRLLVPLDQLLDIEELSSIPSHE